MGRPSPGLGVCGDLIFEPGYLLDLRPGLTPFAYLEASG